MFALLLDVLSKGSGISRSGILYWCYRLYQWLSRKRFTDDCVRGAARGSAVCLCWFWSRTSLAEERLWHNCIEMAVNPSTLWSLDISNFHKPLGPGGSKLRVNYDPPQFSELLFVSDDTKRFRELRLRLNASEDFEHFIFLWNPRLVVFNGVSNWQKLLGTEIDLNSYELDLSREKMSERTSVVSV